MNIPRTVIGLVFLIGCLLPGSAISNEKAICSYNTWSWNTLKNKSEGHQRIIKKYSEISGMEIDQDSGCTVCEEDQAWIKIEGLEPFRICNRYKDRITEVLNRVIASGFPLFEITGYRVGKSKGPVDQNGLRARFSNHSFGTALDINRGRNGLYNNCTVFNSNCILALGGAWDPNLPGAITKDSIVVRQFESIQWKWGGEIKGRQKDFMHFSPLGY